MRDYITASSTKALSWAGPGIIATIATSRRRRASHHKAVSCPDAPDARVGEKQADLTVSETHRVCIAMHIAAWFIFANLNRSSPLIDTKHCHTWLLLPSQWHYVLLLFLLTSSAMSEFFFCEAHPLLNRWMFLGISVGLIDRHERKDVQLWMEEFNLVDHQKTIFLKFLVWLIIKASGLPIIYTNLTNRRNRFLT